MLEVQPKSRIERFDIICNTFTIIARLLVPVAVAVAVTVAVAVAVLVRGTAVIIASIATRVVEGGVLRLVAYRIIIILLVHVNE